MADDHWWFPIAGSVLLLILALPVSLNAQQISFERHVVDAEGPQDPWAKMMGDVDGDGRADVVIGGRDGPLVWYEAPDWTMHSIVNGGYDTVDGELGDINGDGYADVVMGGLFWYENPGSDAAGSWKAHRIADHPTHDVDLGDLNGDGKLDIVTRGQSAFSNPAGNEVYVWLQVAPNTWNQHVIECPHGEGIRLADLNDDDRPDIVIGGYWFANKGDPVSDRGWTKHQYGSFHPNASVAVADINDDGRKDIVLTPAELEDDYYRISWFEAPEDLTAYGWEEHVIDDDVEAVYHSLEVADVNNDGLTDVVTAEMHQSEDPDEVIVYVNDEDGSSWDEEILSERGSHLVQIDDIDGDGDIDILGANWSGDYQPIELWENRGK